MFRTGPTTRYLSHSKMEQIELDQIIDGRLLAGIVLIESDFSMTRKNHEDYAGGGSDFPQEIKDAASPQKGMIDDDMGKYGGVAAKKVPQTVDNEFKRVAGGGSPGSYHGKKQTKQTKRSPK